jgi:glycosyltransferase involved in cell wall biosynthesis
MNAPLIFHKSSRPTVTVCMATYNGELYLRQQIVSIIDQLNQYDSIVIVDDASTDSTCFIIEQLNDPRIVLHKNLYNIGHVLSFEKSLKMAKGEFILLADQDDIWPSGRLDKLVTTACASGSLVLGEYQNFSTDTYDSNNRLVKYKFKAHFFTFIDLFLGRLPILGCVMCFPSFFMKFLLPFPKYVLAHDIYLFQLFLVLNRYRFVPVLVLFHRLHSNNVTPRSRRSLSKVLYSRIIMLFSFMLLLKRLIIFSRNPVK